jgi:hypothetical protein
LTGWGGKPVWINLASRSEALWRKVLPVLRGNKYKHDNDNRAAVAHGDCRRRIWTVLRVTMFPNAMNELIRQLAAQLERGY